MRVKASSGPPGMLSLDGRTESGVRQSSGVGRRRAAGLGLALLAALSLLAAAGMASAEEVRPRFLVIFDTSGSMTETPQYVASIGHGVTTHGDGSVEAPGCDVNGDGLSNDSKMYQAKRALYNVLASFGEVEFGLERFAQNEGLRRRCFDPDVASDVCWPYYYAACSQSFTCGGDCPSGYYRDTCNANDVDRLCDGDQSPLGGTIHCPNLTDEVCINYSGASGDCSGLNDGQVLVPFPRASDNLPAIFSWIDNHETDFQGGSDKELRAIGNTPLAGSLTRARTYLTSGSNGFPSPLASDPYLGCRNYSVILLTDGSETCGGTPATAAKALADLRHNNLDVDVKTYVVGFAICPPGNPNCTAAQNLNAIAKSGDTGQAYLVSDLGSLEAVLTDIVVGSVMVERCNEKDDDCDGLIDEDFPQKGQPCDNGMLGECHRTGVYVCSPDGLGVTCSAPAVQPGEEGPDCDGKDNDCDGQIDEGLNCCVPESEVCNGSDDDCDGQVDEPPLPGEGEACGVSDRGECRLGEQRCIEGHLTCVGERGPTPERCNCKDEDCDGVADNEPTNCPPDTKCIDCECAVKCAEHEFPCPPGRDCRDGYCLRSLCAGVTCNPEEVCVDGRCVDRCSLVSCPEGEVCENGRCIGCYQRPCPAGELCVSGRCREDPCKGVTCPSGEYCKAGKCTVSCAGVACKQGEKCVDGLCVVDLCQTKKCGEGEVCNAKTGECEPDPCKGYSCPKGKVCLAGSCVQDLCELTHCPEGTVCQSPDGQCLSDGTGEPAAGGVVGCGCRVGGRGQSRWPQSGERQGGGSSSGGRAGGLLLAALAALAALALFSGSGRRRRVGRTLHRMAQLVLLGLATLLAGCGAGGAAPTLPDAAVADLARPDIGARDQRPAGEGCIAGKEICDGIDNDCDGQIDEGFDLENDPDHCGSCTERCAFENALARCEHHACVLGDCLPGYWDANGDASDGCEYGCLPTDDPSEVCDGIDNDCNRLVDAADPAFVRTPDVVCKTLGECQGAVARCKQPAVGEAPQWICDYGSGVDLVDVNRVATSETRCDGLDNNCDGHIDEAWTIGRACDDGLLGACHGTGSYACTADGKGMECQITAPGAAARDEECNGLDDDCDGKVDEVEDDAAGKGAHDSMVRIARGALDFWIYKYEASRPDASATAAGTVTSRACSRPGVLPWSGLRFTDAKQACAAAGLRLCKRDEWASACGGIAHQTYPYGFSYQPDACNGRDYAGGARRAVATGSLAQCKSADQIFDLSGNLKEWTYDPYDSPADPGPHVARGGSYDSPAQGLTCDFDFTHYGGEVALPGLGFRCCGDQAP